MERLSGNRGFGQGRTVNTGWAVNILSGVQGAKHRTLTPAVDGDVLSPSQRQESMHVVGDQGLWDVACHRRDCIDLQLVGCEGKQDRYSIVLARISVDYQRSLSSHPLPTTLTRLVRVGRSCRCGTQDRAPRHHRFQSLDGDGYVPVSGVQSWSPVAGETLLMNPVQKSE